MKRKLLLLTIVALLIPIGAVLAEECVGSDICGHILVGLVATPSVSGTGTPTPIPGNPVILAAGDIASCALKTDEATAKVLDNLDGTILLLGDIAYENGLPSEFRNCYDPTWGRHRARTYPSPGNHDYRMPGALAYYAYFGEKAGPNKQGYYSFNLGTWHIISLNSNIEARAGSAQEKWLRADLEANKATCTLAFWHHPLYTSGAHGNDMRMRDVWRTLYEHKVSVVLNGHDHDYERFAPQDPGGNADQRGIREFVVGTGGATLRNIVKTRPNSEAHDSSTWGILKMTLHPTSYDWEFIPIEGQTFRDSGSAACVQ